MELFQNEFTNIALNSIHEVIVFTFNKSFIPFSDLEALRGHV